MFDNLLAIDCGSSAIKVLEMTKNRRSIKRCALQVIPEGSIVDGQIVSYMQVEKALISLLSRLQVSTHIQKTIFGISSAATMIKRIKVDDNIDKGIFETNVIEETEQSFDFSIDELYFDYFRLPKDPNSDDCYVVTVGAKKNIVDQYIGMMKNIGLRVAIIDCNAFALTNLFSHFYPHNKGLSLLIDIGSENTEISFVNNKDYLYTRVIRSGGSKYDKVLSERLKLSLQNANSLKIAVSLEPKRVQPEVQKVISMVNEGLVEEIKKTSNFFYRSTDTPTDMTKVNNIYLVGGAARTLGLINALKNTFNCSVELIAPFENLSVPSRYVTSSVVQGYFFAVAAGMALRTFNEKDYW